jgi:predicted dehydrogenase
MEQVRIGVIGTGLMGTLHARVYAQLANVRLVAVADVDKTRLERVSRELGVRGFTDYHELLERKDIDAVSICVPDELHRDPAIAAAERGKHIMLEKPISTELHEAEEIIAAVRRNGVKLAVGHLLRFDPRYAQIKAALDRGELGELVHITAHRNSSITEGPARYVPGTSLTLHVAVHDMDIINWYAGAKPVRAYAEGVRKALQKREMDDAVSALLKFRDGLVANLQYSWALPAKFPTKLDARMEVIGTAGAAYIGPYAGQGTFIVTDAGVSSPDVHHWAETHGRILGDVREELLHFVDCVAHDKPPLVSGEEALAAVEVALAITGAMATARPVDL